MPKPQYWWLSYGDFSPVDSRGIRPDPAEVVCAYLDKAGISEKDRVQALLERGIKRTTAYELLAGKGFDSVKRCNVLVEKLSIPPQLLGLDGQYRGQKRWWVPFGFPLAEGPDGYPVVGEVMAYLRHHIIRGVDHGVQRVWTQANLATAVGLSEVSIRKMEKGYIPIDSIERRQFIAGALRIGLKGTAMASLVFPLFSLDSSSLTDTSMQSTPLLLVAGKLSPEMFDAHRQVQRGLYEEYYQNHGQDSVEEALAMLSLIDQQVAPLAKSATEHHAVFTLQSFYRQFLALVAYEQNKQRVTLAQLNQSIALADQARAVAGVSADLQLSANLIASTAYMKRARIYRDQKQYEKAVQDIDTSLKLAKGAPNNFLARLYSEAGLVYASSAGDNKAQIAARRYFDNALILIDKSQGQPDPYFMKPSESHVYTLHGQALTLPRMTDNPFIYLDQARKFVSTSTPRRCLLIDLFLSQALINCGDYEQATKVALDALKTAKQVRSEFNKNRVADLNQQLRQTSYASSPLRIQLEVALSMWTLPE